MDLERVGRMVLASWDGGIGILELGRWTWVFGLWSWGLFN